MIYDIIIIGGGISGLYMAYKLKIRNPSVKLLILEKSKLGGRAGTYSFQGVDVVTGAGIGRRAKDYLLRKLLKDLDIPSHEFSTNTYYSPTIPNGPCNIKATIAELHGHYKKNIAKHKGKTFREFAKPILGNIGYQHFTTCAGFTDYENADVRDVLYDYGFEDNYLSWKGFSVPWAQLVQELCKRIGMKHIHTNTEVQQIRHQPNEHFIITTKSGTDYLATKVVIATTIDSVLHLVPEKCRNLYKQIKGQPFLRMYGRFSKASIPIIENFVPMQTIVPGPIHKIIPMQPEKGIYMIVYSDNKGAKYLQQYGENTPENRDAMCRILETSLGIKEDTLKLLAIKSFFWPIGTHYYTPLDQQFKTRQSYIDSAQNPMKDMFVVGEMISIDQGWTQGALDSVEKVFPMVIK